MPLGMRKSSHLTVNVWEGRWDASSRPASGLGSCCQARPTCPHGALGPWVSLLLVVLVLPEKESVRRGRHTHCMCMAPASRPNCSLEVSLPLGTPSSGQKPHRPCQVCVSLEAAHHVLGNYKGRILERLRVPGHRPSNLGSALLASRGA